MELGRDFVVRLRITAVYVIVLLSVATLNLIPISVPIYDNVPIEQVPDNSKQISLAAQGINRESSMKCS